MVAAGHIAPGCDSAALAIVYYYTTYWHRCEAEPAEGGATVKPRLCGGG